MVGAAKNFGIAHRNGIATQVQTLISVRHAHRRSVDSSGNRALSRQCGAGLPSALASQA